MYIYYYLSYYILLSCFVLYLFVVLVLLLFFLVVLRSILEFNLLSVAVCTRYLFVVQLYAYKTKCEFFKELEVVPGT